ncbi:MAG: endonuclease/exonuclease/phosphatase family protein [Nannocystaceae bacterium]
MLRKGLVQLIPTEYDARTGPWPRTAGLDHALGSYLGDLAAIKRRAQLERLPLYHRIKPELDRVLSGFAWRLDPPRPCTRARGDVPPIQAVTWNLERGKQFEAICAVIRNEPRIHEADLLMLTELDIGMTRSGHRNVPRDLADQMGMAYVFANFHLVLSPGDQGERHHGEPNTAAMHGSALLSRFPITRFAAVDLPEKIDKFHVLEKRLGCKRAILCEVSTPSGLLTVVVPHLDPFADGRYRGLQMRRVLRAASDFGGDHVLLGGDLNTNTYHLGSGAGLAFNCAHKLVRLGVDRTIKQYLEPGRIFERPVFHALREGGFSTDGFNDLAKGTYHFDLRDPEIARKIQDYVPRWVQRWVNRRVAPFDGALPMRLDWFAGRGVVPSSPWVLHHPSDGGVRASDHDPLGVTVRLD